MMSAPLDSNHEHATWPWASILFLGTLDWQSPGARRYRRRTWLALGALLAVFPLVMVLSLATDALVIGWLAPILIAAVFSFLVFELWHYVCGLDELSQALQLRAMAITYLIGLPIFVTAHFLAAASAWSWQLPALAYLGLELIRVIVLAQLARKYS